MALTERSPMSLNFNRSPVFFPGQAQPDDKGVPLDVTRVSPEYFALLLAVAALANLVPAKRAARVKPWLALRTD